jgi:hypothetical protein
MQTSDSSMEWHKPSFFNYLNLYVSTKAIIQKELAGTTAWTVQFSNTNLAELQKYKAMPHALSPCKFEKKKKARHFASEAQRKSNTTFINIPTLKGALAN